MEIRILTTTLKKKSSLLVDRGGTPLTYSIYSNIMHNLLRSGSPRFVAPMNYLVCHSGIETRCDVRGVIHSVRRQSPGSVSVQAVTSVTTALLSVEAVVLFKPDGKNSDNFKSKLCKTLKWFFRQHFRYFWNEFRIKQIQDSNYCRSRLMLLWARPKVITVTEC